MLFFAAAVMEARPLENPKPGLSSGQPRNIRQPACSGVSLKLKAGFVHLTGQAYIYVSVVLLTVDKAFKCQLAGQLQKLHLITHVYMWCGDSSPSLPGAPNHWQRNSGIARRANCDQQATEEHAGCAARVALGLGDV